MVKEEAKICVKCNKLILTKADKFVLLGTYSGDEILDESYFHFDCFRLYHEEKTKEKAQNIVNKGFTKIAGMMGNLLRTQDTREVKL